MFIISVFFAILIIVRFFDKPQHTLSSGEFIEFMVIILI